MSRIPTVIQPGPVGTRNPANPARALTPIISTPQRGPALSRQHFADRRLNQIQSAGQQATAQATASDDASCNVIRSVQLTSLTPLVLQHALGRTWTSYRIENVVGGFARFVAIPQGTNGAKGTADATTIQIESDATVTCDVRVW